MCAGILSTPAEQISWRAVTKRGISDDADACIEESCRGDAIHCRPPHLLGLAWRLDCVLCADPNARIQCHDRGLNVLN